MADRPQPLDAEDVWKRLRGIARYTVPDEGLRDEICHRAFDKILGMLNRGAFLRKVVYTVYIDYLRDHDLPLPEEIPFHPAEPSPEAPPLAVIEERLRVLYATGESRPHEALCFAYNVHLGRAPAAVVSELARIPLESLSQSYIDDYVRASGIPRDRIEELFPDLLAIRDTPVGRTVLSDYWDPPVVVAGWVRAEDPADEGPARRIAFLFYTELQYDPWQIVARLGYHTLEELAVRFVNEYGAARGGLLEGNRQRFASWLEMSDVAAKRRLSFYYEPPRAVARWVNAVHRRLESAEAVVEKDGLRVIFDSGPPPETIAFLMTFFFGMSAAEVAKRYANAKLSWLARRLAEAYGQERRLDDNQVQSWFRPLQRQIDRDGSGERHLGEYFSPDLENPALDVSNWRAKTLRTALEAVRNRRDLIIFAHRYNLLKPGRRQG